MKRQAADDDQTADSIIQYFAAIPDPRIKRSQLHPLPSILVLSLIAVICGADSFVGIQAFGEAKEAWLKTVPENANRFETSHTRIL